MSSSLRDDLSALRIDRSEKSWTASASRSSGGQGVRRRKRGFFSSLFSLILWLIPLSLVGAGGYFGWNQYQAIRSRPIVEVGLVQSMTNGEAEKLLSAKGYLKSRNQAAIGAKIPGRVEQIHFEEGMRVKKGQLLAVIDHEDVKVQLETRKAMIAKAEADLAEARADVADKERKSNRANRLVSRNNVVSIEEVEQTAADLDKAKARLLSIEAMIRYQKSLVRETEETIRNMHITAPFDGTVVKKDAELGEMITGGGFGSGISIGRAMIGTLANLSRMDVETDVSENLLSRITVGQPAEISVSAVPDKRYRGRLRQIIPMSDRGRGTVKVMVEFLEPDERLFPELVATVHFLPDKELKTPDEGKTRLFIPKSAVVEENGHSFVWVLKNREKVKKTKVEVVISKDLARVESGLNPGDSVVLSPARTLRDDEIVKIAE